MDIPKVDEIEIPQIVNLSQVKVEFVQADLVRASQSAIQQLTAEEVELQTSAAISIQTSEFQARDSIIGVVSTHQASIVDSLVGAIRADTINFDGFSALVVGDSITNKDLRAVAMVGTNVQADSIQTSILISREVHGNITTIIDGRTAVFAGLAAGAVTGLILLTGRLLFGRKN